MAGSRTVPTLDDVAKTAGVSTATVSRCLNAPHRVVESTRKRVMEAIDTLGYTPNFGARVMAAKRTFTIGAIIPTMENAIFARGLQAFQEELHSRGYTLLVASSAYRADVEDEQIRSLVARGADGLLLIGQDRDPALYSYLERQGVPVLVAWIYDKKGGQTSIGFDNRASMRALAAEVIGQGHRAIAMISGITEGNDRARQRVEGVRDALAAQGMDPAALTIVETPYEVDNGARALAGLMALRAPPTAVMCGNDVLAVGALRQARSMGLKVPGDVSITGFDDIELARIVVPALTTVHVPHREMGRRAAHVLIDMVENKTTPASIPLEASVQIRDSLGPPALAR